MKKFLLSFFVFTASAIYAVYQSINGTSIKIATIPNDTTYQSAQIPASSTEIAQTTPTPTTTSVVGKTPTPTSTKKPTPTLAPTPVSVITKPRGQYTDGTYTGSAVDAYYGMMQVQAVIQGGRLVAINMLQYPSDRRTSQYINGQALPILKSEAIQAQSANIDAVSGASETSPSFIESLGSALTQAKNA